MRAFLAVPAAPDLQHQLAGVQRSLQEAIAGAGDHKIRITWVRSHSVHLTLKFLGDIADTDSESLREHLVPLLKRHRPVALPMARVGVFPRAQAPRTIWVGPTAEWSLRPDGLELEALASSVDEAAGAVGIPRDRQPYRPHLTIGRVRDGERAASKALVQSGILERQLSAGELAVGAVSLIRSDLQPSGPVHTVLWTVTL